MLSLNEGQRLPQEQEVITSTTPYLQDSPKIIKLETNYNFGPSWQKKEKLYKMFLLKMQDYILFIFE